MGGWTPKPRNESAASARMAAATTSVALTMIGPMVFGMMCRRMMRVSPEPDALAASTYSFSRSDRKTPRTIRAMPVQKTSARIIATRDGSPPPVRGRHEQHGERRHGEHEVGEAHERVVHGPAEVAGDRTDRGPDSRGEDRDDERHPEGCPNAVDDATEIVAPELVGSEPVVPFSGGRRVRVREIELVVRVRSELLREDPDEREAEQRDEAHHRQAMAQEPPPCVGPLAARLDLDARLVREREIGRLV